MTAQTNSAAGTLAERFSLSELHVIEPDRQVHAARFTPCGGYLIAGGFTGDIRRWRVQLGSRAEESGSDKAQDQSAIEATELPAFESPGAWVEGLAFHPDGQLMWTGDSWGHLSAWKYDGADSEPVWSVASAHDGWLRQIAVSSDGHRIATCGRDRLVREWNAADGTLQRELVLEHDVMCVCYAPSGQALFAGDDRGSVFRFRNGATQSDAVFDASELYLYHRIQNVGGARALAVDSQERYLAVGGTVPKNGATVQGTPTVVLFDPVSGMRLKALELGQSKDCYVHDLRFHEAGFLIAVTSGTPGTGQILFHDLEADAPFVQHTRVPNCHAASLHPTAPLLAVTATNRRSNGNGRRLDDDGNYIGNVSPVHIFRLET